MLKDESERRRRKKAEGSFLPAERTSQCKQFLAQKQSANQKKYYTLLKSQVLYIVVCLLRITGFDSQGNDAPTTVDAPPTTEDRPTSLDSSADEQDPFFTF